MRTVKKWIDNKNWYERVEEIAQLEELLREAGEPDGHEQAWALHLLQAKLKSKRQSLRAIDIGLMPLQQRSQFDS